MLQAVVSTARRMVTDFHRVWLREPVAPAAASRPAESAKREYGPIKRLTLTDEVARTLFEEYHRHRKGMRGEEETGWFLLGLRDADEATVLATLPAGAESKAGVAHVLFNSNAQAVGSIIVRQADRRLLHLGVVHTHPGSLRHPSDGDFRGDSQWVGRLRGAEGVFGIGTADGEGGSIARQPKPNLQCYEDLCFSWYALRHGDKHYRPLPCSLTLGPDLARSLHRVWPTIEMYAEPLERLHRQQAGVRFEVVEGDHGPALSLSVPLAEPNHFIRVLMEGEDVRYYVARDGELLLAESGEPRIDRGVYLLLAELTAPCC